MDNSVGGARAQAFVAQARIAAVRAPRLTAHVTGVFRAACMLAALVAPVALAYPLFGFNDISVVAGQVSATRAAELDRSTDQCHACDRP